MNIEAGMFFNKTLDGENFRHPFESVKVLASKNFQQKEKVQVGNCSEYCLDQGVVWCVSN